MTKNDVLKIVEDINNAGNIIPSLIAVIDENGVFKLQSLNMLQDDLATNIKEISNRIIETEIKDPDFDVNPISEIELNKATYYEIQQNDDYRIFTLQLTKLDTFDKKDFNLIKGLFIVLNYGNNAIWFYQHKNISTQIKNKIVLFEKDSVFHAQKVDLFKIEGKCSFFMINDSIFTKSIKLLQKEYKFTSFIYSRAKEKIDQINSFGLISDLSKLSSELDNEISGNMNITLSRKLMKIDITKLNQVGKDVIYNRIKGYKAYSDLFENKFDDETKTIKITSKNDVKNLLKVLSNTLLYSPLTDEMIDTAK